LEIDSFDWDLVLFFGTYRVLCESPLKNKGPRISSAIRFVDGSPVTRERLRSVGEGSRIATESGNTYVLRGAPFMEHDLSVNSVFFEPPPPRSWVIRLLTWAW
jgi:hypothetical protein